MNKSILLCLVFFLLLPYSYSQQEYNFTPITTSSYKGDLISTDDKGNLLIGAKSNLTKLSMDGDFIAHFYPMHQGKITCIDAKDPRRILLFYEEYSYVQFLNQELANAASLSIYSVNSRPEPISLENIHLSYASLVCLDEYNEAYWVYDKNTTDIVLVDQDNQIDFKADALDQIMDFDPDPNFMIMEGNRLFINNPSTGVYIFDENGNFVRVLSLVGLKKIQVIDNLLFYTTSNTLIVHNLLTGEESYNILPIQGFTDWALSQDINILRINFLTKSGVSIYSLDKMIK